MTNRQRQIEVGHLLRIRRDMLQRFIDLNAPHQIIDRQRELVERAEILWDCIG